MIYKFKSNKVEYTVRGLKNYTDARHWAINHLDMSDDWAINKTSQKQIEKERKN